MEENKKKVTVYLDNNAYNLSELYTKAGIAKNRGEFISNAIKMYATWLDGQNYTDFLTPAFESVVGAIVKDSASRESKSFFRLSVEVSMLVHAIAIAYDFDEDFISKLRAECINEVKALRGVMPVEDVVKLENSKD